MFGRRNTVDRLQRILGQHHGGVYKRIDENRELLELLQRDAPALLAAQPWVIGWLKSQDLFLQELAATIDLPAIKIRSPSGYQFPRHWPQDAGKGQGKHIETAADEMTSS